MTAQSGDGPFYHGTRADLKVGDLLVAGRRSNFRPQVLMNHVYFTARVDIAALAAALAPGEAEERVYVIEPTGAFEDDPNVTDRKFPGNPTLSFRSRAPLRILGVLEGWARLSEQERRDWRERLSRNTGDIVN